MATANRFPVGGAALAVWLLPAAVFAAQAPRIALLELRTVGVERDAVAGLVPLVAAEAGRPPFRLISQSDIAAVLGLEKQKSLLGCSDAGCYAEVGGALGVQYLLVAEVSVVGGVYLFSLAVLDANSGQGVSRVSKRVPKGETIAGLLDLVPTAVDEAMAPVRAKLSPAPSASARDAEAAARHPAPARSTRRTVGYVADGVGAAALVAAVVLDALAVRDHDAARDLLNGGSEQRFNEAYAAFNSKRAAALTLYGVGGAVLVTGIVLSVLPEARSEAVRVAVSPTEGGASVVIRGGWR
jgi:hypothetical protein